MMLVTRFDFILTSMGNNGVVSFSGVLIWDARKSITVTSASSFWSKIENLSTIGKGFSYS